MPAGALGGGTDPGDDGAVLLVRPVREVEAEDVGAGGDERVEGAFGGTGGANGAQ